MKPWTENSDGSATLHIPTPFGDVKDIEVSRHALDQIASRSTFSDSAVRMWSPEIGQASAGMVRGFLAETWGNEYEAEWKRHRRDGGALAKVARLLGMRPDDLLNGLRVTLDEGALIRGMKHAEKQPVDLFDWTHRFLTGLGFVRRPHCFHGFTWQGRIQSPEPWMGGMTEVVLVEPILTEKEAP